MEAIPVPAGEEPREAMVGLGSASLLLLFWGVPELLFPVLLMRGLDVEEAAALVLGKVASAAATLAFALVALGGRRRRSNRRAVGLAGANTHTLLRAVALGLVTALAQIAWSRTLDPDSMPNPAIHDALDWVAVVNVALLTPLVEEFLCRGYLLAGLRTAFGTPAAGVLVTVFFLVGHPQSWGKPALIVPLAAFAVLALVLRLRSESLLPPLLAHVVYNSTALAILLLT